MWWRRTRKNKKTRKKTPWKKLRSVGKLNCLKKISGGRGKEKEKRVSFPWVFSMNSTFHYCETQALKKGNKWKKKKRNFVPFYICFFLQIFFLLPRRLQNLSFCCCWSHFINILTGNFHSSFHFDSSFHKCYFYLFSLASFRENNLNESTLENELSAPLHFVYYFFQTFFFPSQTKHFLTGNS